MASAPEGLYDCSRLLEHAANRETIMAVHRSRHDFEAPMNFGHPDPPNLHLFSLRSSESCAAGSSDREEESSAAAAAAPVLMIAYTRHCASAQVLFPFVAPTEPFDVCAFEGVERSSVEEDMGDDENWSEEITCLTVVALEDGHLIAAPIEERVTLERRVDDANANGGSVLLKGVVSDYRENETRLTVILGTNRSRVYSSELAVDRSDWSLRPVAGGVSDDSDNDGAAASGLLFEVLPFDDVRTAVERRGDRAYAVPFHPRGGVTSLSAFRIDRSGSGEDVVHVWVAYRDGTVVRLHHAGFFPSVWQKGAQEGRSLDELFGSEALVRYRVNLPPDTTDLNIVPLPKHHPSPLAPLLPCWKPVLEIDAITDVTSPDLMSCEEREQEEAESFEALVFGMGPDSSAFPTLCFYTSEIQFTAPDNGGDPDTGSTATTENAVLGAVVGGLRGVMRFLGGSRLPRHDETPVDHGGENSKDEGVPDDAAPVPFPSLWREPVELFAGHELHDAPREIESCSVDPDGLFAAVTDSLGRVILVELENKQVIRLWKGFRDASCSWIECRRPQDEALPRKKQRLLAIHSRQRRVVEVWRVRHGSRLSSVPVGRDAQIVSCGLGAHKSHETACYLVHSRVAGTSMNHMEKISVDWRGSDSLVNSINTKQRSKFPSAPTSREAAVRLQHLQQLLSTTNVKYTSKDVFEALKEIKSLADLSTSLDLLACTPLLEEELGVEGSAFHKMSLNHCSSTLEEALKSGDGDIHGNPNVTTLRFKIEYHNQIVLAYDLLHKFESSPRDSAGHQMASTPSHWSAEALGWLTTYEQVMSASIDAETPSVLEGNMRFATFASCCAFPTQRDDSSASRLRVYFSDSSRTRRDVLVHVFSPLLADIFSFGVVNGILEALRIKDDDRYTMKCFGEWFMTLTAKEAWEKGMYTADPPMARLLQDLASRQLERKKDRDAPTVALDVLHTFCKESTDLVRAFMLATICREAVAKASMKKEWSSYGKILSSRLVTDWDALLRKLRVCLLVSLRLKSSRLSAPMSVQNVDQEDIFSVYEWLAMDELSMTHKHEEIVSLETACEMSSYAFDPSTANGDGPSRFKMLQESCLSAAISEEERAEYLVDFEDDDRFGALLLFLGSHNEPTILVAHRALLLASEWCRDPKRLDVLEDVLVSLKNLKTSAGFGSLATAVRLEVWHSLCPVYRAHLFGFDDVQQMSEEALAPLLDNTEWLIAFGRIALQVLNLLTEAPWEEKMNVFEQKLKERKKVPTWPTPRTDFKLNRLVEKLRKIDSSALDAHCVVVCALIVSGDIERLVQCVPAIYECFLPLALFNPVTGSANLSTVQSDFLEDALIRHAQSYNGPSMDNFALGEIETLSNIWGFDLTLYRTLFLLVMYELGKDRIVDELLTKSSSQIQVLRFVEDGVDIACRRLNAFLNGKEMRSAEMRETMGLLDADLCEWIQERARKANSLAGLCSLDIPVGNTHLFSLRLLSMSASAKVDTTLRVKIHSLVVLTGTLVKALEKLR